MSRRVRFLKTKDLDILWTESRTMGKDMVMRCVRPNPQTARVLSSIHPVKVGDQMMISKFLGTDISDIPVGTEFSYENVITFWNALQKPAERWFGIIGYAGTYKVTMLMIFPTNKPYLKVELEVSKTGEEGTTVFGGKKILIEDPSHRWVYWEIPQPQTGHVYKLRWTWADD